MVSRGVKLIPHSLVCFHKGHTFFNGQIVKECFDVPFLACASFGNAFDLIVIHSVYTADLTACINTKKTPPKRCFFLVTAQLGSRLHFSLLHLLFAVLNHNALVVLIHRLTQYIVPLRVIYERIRTVFLQGGTMPVPVRTVCGNSPTGHVVGI